MRAHILFGLGFGDEGKGTMVDYLCRKYSDGCLVVRYNGGSQAGHNVIARGGMHHTFSQIGSGAFVPGVKTLLSKYMLWDPIALAHEASDLSPKICRHALEEHYVDERTPVITPFHVATNQLKEWSRGSGRHGSCGKGVGELAYDLVYHPDEVVQAGHLKNTALTEHFLAKLQERLIAWVHEAGIDASKLPTELSELSVFFTDSSIPGQIASAYRELAGEFNIVNEAHVQRMMRASDIVFEGAQGMLLDEWHGFHPYTTWSTVTPKNALILLNEAGFDGDIEITGIMRSYLTRHGAGPFPTESEDARMVLRGEHNDHNQWQGQFRVGYMDGVLLRYAVECMSNMRDEYGMNIAVTHLDSFERVSNMPYCDEYAMRAEEKDQYADVGSGGDRNHMSRLIPNFEEDLGHQARLTELLFASKGKITNQFSSTCQLLEYVEMITGIPVKYASFGPKHADKSECS